MSSKPAQITALDRVASRRNVIRAAAWTAPAVSIVVAAPAFAVTSNGTLVLTDNSSSRASKDITLKTLLTLTSGSKTLTSVTATVRLSTDTIKSAVPTVPGWTLTTISTDKKTATFQNAGPITVTPTSPLRFEPKIGLQTGAKGALDVFVNFNVGGGELKVSLPA